MGEIFVATDNGNETTKVCIWNVKKGPRAHVIDIIEQSSTGMRQGCVEDLKGEASRLKEIIQSSGHVSYVSRRALGLVDGPDLLLRLETAESNLGVRVHIEKLHIKALENVIRSRCGDTEAILHIDPIEFEIDHLQTSRRSPVGLVARHLKMTAAVVTAKDTLLANRLSVLKRARLRDGSQIASFIAAGWGVLTRVEREHGAAVIDIGADTTTVTVFYKGALQGGAVLPLGGRNITWDLAHALGVSEACAEKIKRSCGVEMETSDEPHVTVSEEAPGNGGGARRFDRGDVIAVIRASVARIFDWAREEIDRSNHVPLLSRGFVLTGGGARLRGIEAFVASRTAVSTQVRKPLTEEIDCRNQIDSSHACLIGMILYAMHHPEKFPWVGRPEAGRFQWLRARLRRWSEGFGDLLSALKVAFKNPFRRRKKKD